MKVDESLPRPEALLYTPPPLPFSGRRTLVPCYSASAVEGRTHVLPVAVSIPRR